MKPGSVTSAGVGERRNLLHVFGGGPTWILRAVLVFLKVGVGMPAGHHPVRSERAIVRFGPCAHGAGVIS